MAAITREPGPGAQASVATSAPDDVGAATMDDDADMRRESDPRDSGASEDPRDV